MGPVVRAARILGGALLRLLALCRANGERTRMEPHHPERRPVAGPACGRAVRLPGRHVDRPPWRALADDRRHTVRGRHADRVVAGHRYHRIPCDLDRHRNRAGRDLVRTGLCGADAHLPPELPHQDHDHDLAGRARQHGLHSADAAADRYVRLAAGAAGARGHRRGFLPSGACLPAARPRRGSRGVDFGHPVAGRGSSQEGDAHAHWRSISFRC
jgi:hypothetical protein